MVTSKQVLLNLQKSLRINSGFLQTPMPKEVPLNQYLFILMLLPHMARNGLALSSRLTHPKYLYMIFPQRHSKLKLFIHPTTCRDIQLSQILAVHPHPILIILLLLHLHEPSDLMILDTKKPHGKLMALTPQERIPFVKRLANPIMVEGMNQLLFHAKSGFRRRRQPFRSKQRTGVSYTFKGQAKDQNSIAKVEIIGIE